MQADDLSKMVWCDLCGLPHDAVLWFGEIPVVACQVMKGLSTILIMPHTSKTLESPHA